jgi:hypothetical protein
MDRFRLAAGTPVRFRSAGECRAGGRAGADAFVLAAARRVFRAPGSPPLGTIRSLAYFSAVMEEVLELRVKPEYFQYLRDRRSDASR